MKLKIYDNSKNYTAQIIKLNSVQKLEGLDNLVGAYIQGQLALITKDYPINQLYVFFPSGCVLSEDFVSLNNLYREETLNKNIKKKGFFEPNRRTKAVKFRGHKSTAFLCPLSYLAEIGVDIAYLKEGDEFNEVDGIHVCRKYVLPVRGNGTNVKKVKLLDNIVDNRFMPEHMDTDMLLKYLHHIDLHDQIVITTKLHGTSARVGYTLTKRKLSIRERIAKFFGCKVQEDEYKYVVGSHHVIKSVNFETLSGKNHFYSEDLWTKVSDEFFKNKLLKGEIVYFEIIGKDYQGKEIQKDYAYKLNKPDIYVYRISHINPDGIETDLSWKQVKVRCNEMAVQYVPEIYVGNVRRLFIQEMRDRVLNPDFSLNEIWEDFDNKWRQHLEQLIKDKWMDKPSTLDPEVIEEGICIRKEQYPRPKIYKVKAPLFYIHEGVLIDKGIVDIEEQQVEGADDVSQEC